MNIRPDPSPSITSEAEVILRLLGLVHSDSALTQRRIATELGIAVGMANAYLRRCVKKGLIKIEQVPANRYMYYLTPTGFAEKSRLSLAYLTQSFGFFRAARRQCEVVVENCLVAGHRRLALFGASELADVFMLCIHDLDVSVICLVDEAMEPGRFHGRPRVSSLDDVADVEAVVLTDLKAPLQTYETLRRRFEPSLIHVPKMLCMSEGDLRGLGCLSSSALVEEACR